MREEQKIDHYHRCITALDLEEMCIVLVPTKILQRASMDIGDQFIAEPKANGFFIKKVK